jgi:hypothetical protein
MPAASVTFHLEVSRAIELEILVAGLDVEAVLDSMPIDGQEDVTDGEPCCQGIQDDRCRSKEGGRSTRGTWRRIAATLTRGLGALIARSLPEPVTRPSGSFMEK